MNFWVDMAFAVIFRLLKDAGQVTQFQAALCKLRDILNNLPLGCDSPKP